MTKKKIKIAMLGHKRMPSREGGIEVVVEELSTRMVKLGYEVTSFNRKGHHVSGEAFDDKNTNNYLGVVLKTVPTIDRKGIAAITASVFAAICVAFGKYDVAHFHAEGPCAMIWLPKLFGKRCIVTIHGLDHKRAKWGKLASTYIMVGEKMAVKYAHEIIVLSKHTQDYFETKYERKTRFIPNGVNRPEILKPILITEKYGLRKDNYLLFLGRLVPEKGLKYLLNAFKGLETDKKMVIAGGASDTVAFVDELKLIAAGDNRIIFTGFVQGQVLEELYSNAYIYILPSDLEGMPLSLLEGMSYGNCCVTSDIAECLEVVEDKAVIFEKSNVEDLRKKIQILCDDSILVQKYKNVAADFICQKYNWDEIVKKTIELYEG